MIPDLPATVWLRIATFLVPDELDEVGERVGRKARARQSQLTALLSLSKAVYQGIIPALYGAPIVTDLSAFIASSHPVIRSRLTDKSPLDHARGLHLSLPSGPTTPETITNYCVTLVETISTLLQSGPTFPHLHLISLGRYPPPDTGWSTFHLDIAGSPRQSIIALTQRSILALLKHLDPAVIHQYTSSGPLAFSYLTLNPPFNPTFPPDPIYSTLHEAASIIPLEYPSGSRDQRFIHQALTTAISYPLIRNSINEWRIIYNHGDMAIYNDQTESKLIFTMALYVAGAVRQWRLKGLDVGGTKVEIVGLGCKMEVKREIWKRSVRYRREMAEIHRMPIARSDYDRRTALAAEKKLQETRHLSEAEVIEVDKREEDAARWAFQEQLERLVSKDTDIAKNSEGVQQRTSVILCKFR